MGDTTGLSLQVAEDESQVVITGFAPQTGARPLTAAAVRAELQALGVKLAPDAETLDKALRLAAAGKNLCGLVLVRSLAPDPGENGYVKPLGELRLPVLPGDVFARIMPPRPPAPGRSVLGKEILPPKDQVRGANPSVQDECEVTPDGGGIRARVYGLAAVAGNKVRLEPLLKLHRDRMCVTGHVYARAFDGRGLTLDDLRRALAAQGIKAEFAAGEVGPALEKARKSGRPSEDVVFCRGRPPVPGEDGRFEFSVEVRQSTGRERADGSIDFRERDTIHNVDAGTLLGRVIPPTPGTPGRDVMGNPIPARSGNAVSILVGENVEISPDGMEYRATAGGIVVFCDNRLAVTDVLEIPGDVDLSTGNIHTETGSIVIGGSVRSGFTVEAGGSITVKESIEHARVSAGGDITVARGIVMHAEEQAESGEKAGKGRKSTRVLRRGEDGGEQADNDAGPGGFQVRAGGSVFAHYARNVAIEAGQDVVVENDLTNCRVEARGRIIAVAGKGRIQGGELRCGRGVEVNELGSELGVITTVILGFPSADAGRLRQELDKLQAMVRKISLALGTGDARAILLRTHATKRRAVAELLKARISANERMGKLETALAAEAERVRQQARARIKVRGTVHPGLRLRIAGGELNIEQAISCCQFYLDPKEDRIQMAPLA